MGFDVLLPEFGRGAVDLKDDVKYVSHTYFGMDGVEWIWILIWDHLIIVQPHRATAQVEE